MRLAIHRLLSVSGPRAGRCVSQFAAAVSMISTTEASGLDSDESLPVMPRYDSTHRESGGSWSAGAYFTLGIALALLSAYTVARGDDAPIILALVALPVAIVTFRRCELPLFMVALAANLIALICIAEYYRATTGRPFSAGGDELFFFSASADVARDLIAGRWAAASAYSNYSGYGFILVGGALQALLSSIGQFSPLTLRVANALVGATIGPGVYRIAKSFSGLPGRTFPVVAALLGGVFPTLVAYAASGLRDIWLTAATVWVVALLACRARTRVAALVKDWASIGVLLVLVYYFRPESLVSVLVFVAVWLLLKVRRGSRAVLILASIATALVMAKGITLLMQDYQSQRIAYTELALDQAGGGSLGAEILRLPHPVTELARFAYAAYAPIPPSFAGGPDRWLIGVGATFWYFVLPFAVAGLFIAWRAAGPVADLALATATSCFSLIAGVALTSLDVRHKTVVMPLLAFFAAYALYRLTPRQAVRRVAVLAFGYVLLFVMYYAVKAA